MASKYMKCSTSLVIKEIQITTTHFISSQLEWPYSRTITTKNAGEYAAKPKPFMHCCWECRLVQPLWETVWRFLKKLNIELPYDPVILLLGIYSKEHKSGYNRDTCTPMFITIHNSQALEKTQVPYNL
jgi:hypothetical protein